jgi:hypothetical protein
MLFNDRRAAKKAASATTKAQIGAMAKGGTLRSAGPASTHEEKSQNHYDRENVKYEAQYGYSGRSATGERLPRKDALRNAGKKLDKEGKL